MKTYAGVTEDSAAESLIPVNTFQQPDDVQVHQELLEKPQTAIADDEPPQSARLEGGQPSDKELNFRALRDEITALKNEKDELEANFKLLRSAQIDQPRHHQEPPPAPRKMLEGLNDDDIPTAADIRRAWEEREVEYLGRINELQLAQSHPDYEEIINKYTIPLLNEKPHLAAALHDPRTRFSAAYDIGKLAQQQAPKTIPQSTTPSEVAQKIVDNARKPGTLSGAGGQNILSKADYYSSMSDKEFAEIAMRNMGEI